MLFSASVLPLDDRKRSRFARRRSRNATRDHPPQGGHGHVAGQGPAAAQHKCLRRDRGHRADDAGSARDGQAHRQQQGRRDDLQRRRHHPQAARHRAPRRQGPGGHCPRAGRGGRRRHDVGGAAGRRAAARGQAVHRGGGAPAGRHQGLPDRVALGDQQGQGARGLGRAPQRGRVPGPARKVRSHGHVLQAHPLAQGLFQENGGRCRAAPGPGGPEREHDRDQEDPRRRHGGLDLCRRRGVQKDLLVRRLRAAAEILQGPQDPVPERGARAQGRARQRRGPDRQGRRVPGHRGRRVADHLREAGKDHRDRRQGRPLQAAHRRPGHAVLCRPQHLLRRQGGQRRPRARGQGRGRVGAELGQRPEREAPGHVRELRGAPDRRGAVQPLRRVPERKDVHAGAQGRRGTVHRRGRAQPARRHHDRAPRDQEQVGRGRRRRLRDGGLQVPPPARAHGAREAADDHRGFCQGP